jgi:autotransporter-associated beta strand protein
MLIVQNRSAFTLFFTIAASLSLTQVGRAQTVWNGTTDATWNTSSNWSAGTPQTGDTATFNNGGNTNTTIDLGGSVTVGNSVLFDTSSATAYIIGAGAVNSQSLTINNGGFVTVNNAVTAAQTFNAALVLGTDATAQTFTFTNNGTGTLTFAGSISGGSGGVAGTQTLAFAGSGAIAASGVISDGGGSVALTKSGAGTLTLSATNLFTGGTTITGGVLSIANDGNLGAIPGTATANSITINGGTLQLTAGTAAGGVSGAVTLNANRGISLGSSNGSINLTFGFTAVGSQLGTETAFVCNSVISGNGGLTVNGIGGAGVTNQSILDLGVAATYAGNTTINNAVVQVNSGTTGTNAGTTLVNVLPTTTVLNLVNHGLFNMDSQASSLTVAGLTGDSTGAIGTTNASNAVTLTITGNGTYSFPGVIGAVTVAGKTGASSQVKLAINAPGGTQTLSGTNTFTGGTTILAGTLSIGLDVNLGAPPGAVSAANVTLNGGTLQVTAGTAFGTATLVSNRGITLGASGGTIKILNAATGNFSSNEVAVRYTGIIAGTASGNSLTVTGGIGTNSGTAPYLFELGGVSTYTGPTTINNASVAMNPNGGAAYTNVLPATTVLTLINNGWFVLDQSTSSQQIAGLIGTGNVATTNAGAQNQLKIAPANGQSYTFSGIIGPQTFLNKTGSAAGIGLTITGTGTGTQILTGANTYGTTTINGGTLVINGNQSGATGAVAVNSGGTLRGIGTIGGAVTVNSGGTIQAGNFAVGPLTLNTGLTVASGGIFGLEIADGTTPSTGTPGSSTVGTPPTGVTSNNFYNIAGGTTTINSAAAITVAIDAGTTFQSGASYSYKVASGAGNQSNGGNPLVTASQFTFTGIPTNIDPTSVSLTGDASGGIYLNFTTTVPEPAALLGLAAFALLPLRRRLSQFEREIGASIVPVQ